MISALGSINGCSVRDRLVIIKRFFTLLALIEIEEELKWPLHQLVLFQSAQKNANLLFCK